MGQDTSLLRTARKKGSIKSTKQFTVDAHCIKSGRVNRAVAEWTTNETGEPNDRPEERVGGEDGTKCF